MSEAVRAIWTSGTTAAIKTGSWRLALPKYVSLPAPCHDACPVDGEIAVWIQHVRDQAYKDAWLALIDNNPLPATTGRICHRPCEESCNRGQHDESIAIRCLERFVGDMALEQDWRFPEAPATKADAVAVVGGGPAGLAASFHLRRMGYAVTLIEARPQLGGVLRYGIPEYRLPRDVCEAEIQRLLNLGIEVRTDTKISTPAEFRELCSGFAAVFLATGAGIPRRLPQLDYSLPAVIDGADYLERSNANHHPDDGQRIVVIGGGSAALDVARTARRRGGDVVIVCLESEAAMPAQREEVEEAKEEGITLLDGVALDSVADRGQSGFELACVKVEFEPAEVGGQFSVSPIPDSEFTIAADIIVPAIGQDPDISGLQELVNTQAGLVHVDERLATNVDGVFAGGDLTSNERFVSVALGVGKRAAAGIDHYLRPAAVDPESASPPVPIGAINTHYHPRAARAKRHLRPAAERSACFDEADLVLPAADAGVESERCFSCGQCTQCDNCFYYCPDMAIMRENGGYSVDEDYCKGCGLCVSECPTGAIVMQADR